MKKGKTLPSLTFIMVSATIIMSFLIKSPFFQESGQVYRIIFIHVPLAWISFLAFFIVAITSFLYLKTSKRKYDIYAFTSAEIGVVFSTLTLITGSIWAKAIWGTWWSWDPRLTTTLITWIIYLAYLTLRNSLQTEKKARLSAVYGIIAFLTVPITYLSIRRSRHPQPITGGGISLSIATGLILGSIAFTILYLYLLDIKSREKNTEDKIRILEKKKTNSDMK